MANNSKVLSSIKNFLERMKAHDEDIPEEIGNDALEMVEEVKDALEEEVEVKEEAKDECENKDEDKCEDEETCKDEDIEKKVEDAIGRALKKYGLIKDGAMESLDELEEKLGEEKETDEDSEEGVIEDPEKMNDSAKLRLIRKIKPIIADVKDSRSRKILSDSFVKAMNMNSNTFDYGSLYSAAKSNVKDSVPKNDNDYDYGMEIAKKYNPHYKEEN